MNKRIVIPYAPRDAFKPFHSRTERWAIIVAHRRAGKTVAALNDMLRRALTEGKENGRYAYVAPTYAQAKDVVWSYVKHFAGVLPDVAFNESELRCDLPNGARVRLYGAENYDRMRGLYLDGVILDEAGDMSPQVYSEVIRPALSDRQGWAVWIGTPRGDNRFRDVWDTWSTRGDEPWFRLELRASATGILPEHELEAARRQMTPAQYAQEYECSFDAPVVGAYYADLIAEAEEDGRVTSVPHDRYVMVDTAWDLGRSDSTAIWFLQRVGGEVRAIDYHEDSGRTLLHYAEVLRERGYDYGTHYLPHDIAQHELMSPLSRMQTLRELGFDDGRLGRRIDVIPQHAIMDGINGVRRLIPRMRFDAEKCRDGLRALKMYRRKYDDRKQVFLDRPLHDEHSHGADALRYYAAGWIERTADNRIVSDAYRRRHERARRQQASGGGWLTV